MFILSNTNFLCFNLLFLSLQSQSSPTTTTWRRVPSNPNSSASSSLCYKHRSHCVNGDSISLDRRKIEEMDAVDAAAKLRSKFFSLLSSRRSAKVPLEVKPAKPVKEPLYQGTPPPKSSEVMESCPKADIPNFKQLLNEENLCLTTEEGEQGHLPVLILSMKESTLSKRPAIVFLHSTNKCKEWVRPLLEAYASRGYVAVAIDSRYHGERAKTRTTYADALVSSWKNGDTMPFIFDTVWDLVKLADYLTARDDIDHSKIGITGESLGGMHAWFAAFLETRYSVVVPIIGIQGFRWAVDNDKWQARVDSIRSVFEGAEDPRCPMAGLDVTISKTCRAYEKANCADNFKVIAEAGIGHEMTSSMVKEASNWFDKYLKS
ncbi:hypothetical protein E3N88_35492 [Mikania micrantha]|uniref:Peptidase S9 prolyl oligopeptidase catalytic domain-containing protein n=1 Tax=Mikania micrantha TaxID=192012 RepID=A0A5N6M1H3_9ASTR|nr:hypothetical protein E3N88_35492 [Mikania micrantha]